MDYLKEKVYKIKDVARHVIYKNRMNKLDGKKLFDVIVKSLQPQLSFNQIKLIVDASLQNSQFPQIVQAIQNHLIDFKYDTISVKKTGKTVSLCLQILKNGNAELAQQLKRTIPHILALQQVNSQYFNAFTNRQAKILNYCLENIKQRSKYIHMLITDRSFLLQQREQSTALPKAQMTQIGQATTFNLNIVNVNVRQKIPTPKIMKVHSRGQSKTDIQSDLTGQTNLNLRKKSSSKAYLQRKQFQMQSQIQQ